MKDIPEKNSEKADKILYEYFKINRYPKKQEKIKLAQKANVDFQYVVNFFYNARSQVKKDERDKHLMESNNIISDDNTNRLPGLSHNTDHHTDIKRSKGNCNFLYLNPPVLQRNLKELESNQDSCKDNNDDPNQKFRGLGRNDFYY